jgi:hypothetical protein
MEDKTLDLIKEFDEDKDFMIYPLTPEECAVTLNDVEEIEKTLGVKFPDEYKAHILGKVPGMLVEVIEDIWPRQKGGGAAWKFFYELHTFTASKDSEDWMRLEIEGKKFIEENGLKAVPILKITHDADVFCVNEDGKIVQFKHEEGVLSEIKMNFWELLDYELKELKKRKEKMKMEIKK